MLKTSQKFWSIIIFALIGFFWVASSLFAGDGELVILHTNDIHGAFLPRQATWIDSRPMIGGFAPLSGAIASERVSDEATILLDAGDFMTGNPITTLTVDGVEGGAMLQFFDLMKYNAITLGNHEFDLGVGSAVNLVNASKVPILSANLWMVIPDAISQKPIARLLTGKGWKIFDVGGVRIGVIGLIMEDLAGSIGKSAAESIQVTPAAEEVRKIVADIDPMTDLIILLTHQGYEEDQQLATEVEGVDVIIGGHSHTRVQSPQKFNNVIVAQAGAYCQYLGRLWVKIENDEVSDFRGSLIPLWVDSLQPTPEAAEFVQKYQNEIDRQFGKVITALDEDWTRDSYNESALGDWLADRLQEYGNGDFAVVNSGGIRKNLLKGPVTIMDIKEMLPFANRVVSFPCTGEQLATLIATNARVGMTHSGEILQISGISYDIDPSSTEPYNIMVGSEPLDMKKQYKGISIDYVAISQAQRYFGFTPASHDDLGIQFTDMIVDYITQHGINKKPPMGRIVVKER